MPSVRKWESYCIKVQHVGKAQSSAAKAGSVSLARFMNLNNILLGEMVVLDQSFLAETQEQEYVVFVYSNKELSEFTPQPYITISLN